MVTIPNRIVHSSDNSHQSYMNDTSFKCVFFYYVTLVHLGLAQGSSHTSKGFGQKKTTKYIAKKIKLIQVISLLVKSPKKKFIVRKKTSHQELTI
jgi:hypothetical protein